MKLLDHNSDYLLIASSQQVFLIDAQDFRIMEAKTFHGMTKSVMGSLQYSTGIAAASVGSIVHVYDFLNNRELYRLNTYKKVLKICLKKNILLVVSEFRILIHNLQSKFNECYLETVNGALCLLNPDYYHLSMFYPQTPNKLVHKEVWSQKSYQIQGVKYSMGTYFNKGSNVALVLENVLSIYQDAELIKVYGFDFRIQQILSIDISHDKGAVVLVLLQNGEIIGHDLAGQYEYQFEQIKTEGLQMTEIWQLSSPEVEDRIKVEDPSANKSSKQKQLSRSKVKSFLSLPLPTVTDDSNLDRLESNATFQAQELKENNNLNNNHKEHPNANIWWIKTTKTKQSSESLVSDEEDNVNEQVLTEDISITDHDANQYTHKLHLGQYANSNSVNNNVSKSDTSVIVSLFVLTTTQHNSYQKASQQQQQLNVIKSSTQSTLLNKHQQTLKGKDSSKAKTMLKVAKDIRFRKKKLNHASRQQQKQQHKKLQQIETQRQKSQQTQQQSIQ